MSLDRRNLKKTHPRMLSITAMFAAFTIIVLYLASVFPSMKLTFYFLSSVFIMGVLVEGMTGMAFLQYIVVSGLSLILMPVSYALPYIILFGHYGIGKFLIETKIRSFPVAFVLKLIYFDVALLGVYFAVVTTGLLPLGEIFDKLPIWAWALIAQPVFFIYDYLFSKITGFYNNAIRSRISRSA